MSVVMDQLIAWRAGQRNHAVSGGTVAEFLERRDAAAAEHPTLHLKTTEAEIAEPELTPVAGSVKSKAAASAELRAVMALMESGHPTEASAILAAALSHLA